MVRPILRVCNVEMLVARAMIAASAQTIIVADHTKIIRAAPFNVCNLSEIGMLVSDKTPDSKLVRGLNNTNVNVYKQFLCEMFHIHAL